MSNEPKSIRLKSALTFLVASAVVLGGLFAGVPPVFANHGGTTSAACIRDASGFNQGNICIANDVRIGKYDLVGPPTSCQEGEVLTVTLRARVESGPERYDIGLWVDELGGNAQDNGNLCYRDYLHPLSGDNADLNLTRGSGPYFNGEIADFANGDVCGDVQAASDAGTDPANIFPCSENGGACVFTFYEFTTTITCRDSDGNGVADVGTCTSWDNQISNNDIGTCGDRNPAHPELETIPGTSSKCHCGSVEITGLSVPAATLSVVKTADPTAVDEPGGDVTFTFAVTNNDNAVAVNLNSLIDSIYGDLNGQGDCFVPQVLAPNGQTGDSYTCSITANVAGNAGTIETNVVTASGTDANHNAVSGIDDATVTLNDVLPSIDVTKVATPDRVSEPGGDVTFTFTVTNLSTVEAVTLDALVDSLYGDLNGQGDCSLPQTLASHGQAGDSYTCSITAYVGGNADDVVLNEITAHASDDEGNIVMDMASETVTILDDPSAIQLLKTAVPSNLDEPGGSVTFTFEVTNLSLVDTVTLDSLTDSIYGDLTSVSGSTCTVPHTLLPENGQPGGTDTYTCSITVDVTGDAGKTETNVATAMGTDDDGVIILDDDSATVTINDVPPTVTLENAASLTTQAVTDGDFVFTLQVTNTSEEDVTITALTDTNSGSTDFTACAALVGTVLTPGETVSCEYTVHYTQAGSFDNTVNVTVQDNDNTTASDSASTTVTVIVAPPDLTVLKRNDADMDGTFSDAETVPVTATYPKTVTYQVQITNNSRSDATITAISDNPHDITGSSCAALLHTTIAAGETKTCTFAATFANADQASVTNTFSVTAENDGGSDTKRDTSTVNFAQNPALTIDKSASVATYDAVGQVVNYRYLVTNTGNVTIRQPLTINDDVTTDEACPAAPVSLAPGDTISCTASYTITQADLDHGFVTNVALATGKGPNNTDATSPTDTETVYAVQNPDVTLDKTGALNLGADGTANPGDVITYSFKVTNSGNVTLSHLSVTDPMVAVISCPSENPMPVLAPGATETCTGLYMITQADIDAGHKDNTALASGQGPQGQPAEDDDDHSEPIPQNPSIQIVKNFDPSTVTAGDANGGSFTLVVTNDGNVTLSDALIEDTIDARLQVTHVSGTVGANTDSDSNAQTAEWWISSLAPGQSETITVNFVVDASVPEASGTDAVHNVATVAAEAPQGDPGDPADNVTATDQDTVDILVDINLSIVKTFDPATLAQGDIGAFTLVVSNVGPSDAVGVEVTDTVSDLLKVTTAAVTSGTGDCTDTDRNAQTVECEVDVPEAASVTITVTYIAAPALPQTPQFNTQKGNEFRFVFVNGYTLIGSTDADHNGGVVTLMAPDGTKTQIPFVGGKNDIVFDPPADNPMPGVDDAAFRMHLSCSDPFTDGWGEKDGPVAGVDVNWQIANFSINRYNSARGFFKTCGGTPNPFQVPNTGTATGQDSFGKETVSDDASVQITAPSGVSLGEVSFKNRDVFFRLNNVSSKDVLITQIEITWPEDVNGALTRIQLGQSTIWTGSETGPTAIFMEADFTGQQSNRLLQALQSEKLRFTFANRPVADPATTPYTFVVTFGDETDMLLTTALP